MEELEALEDFEELSLHGGRGEGGPRGEGGVRGRGASVTLLLVMHAAKAVTTETSVSWLNPMASAHASTCPGAAPVRRCPPRDTRQECATGGRGRGA